MKTTVSIPGIHCASCESLIRDISAEFPAITNVTVDLTTKKVELEHDKDFDLSLWKLEVQLLGDKYIVHPVS